MKALSPGLLAHYAQGTTMIATCWKVSRTDGVILTATAHPEDIVFGGATYVSVAGYTMSDQDTGSELSPDNFELEGFLASPAITLADIHAGVWDGAAVEMFEVNYANTSQGRNLLQTGTLGELKGSRSKFGIEVRGLAQTLTRRIVRLMSKECNADLGDARCTLDLAAFTASGTVTNFTERRTVVADVFAAQASDYYAGGVITFTSGENLGLGMEVMTNTQGTSTAVLYQQMPFDIAIGDTFTVCAGCKKRLTEDCIGKFSNGINFRGFPYLPQSDVYKGPNS
jgi:uncharacterized phage protein (TIGR02218 family)